MLLKRAVFLLFGIVCATVCACKEAKQDSVGDDAPVISPVVDQQKFVSTLNDTGIRFAGNFPRTVNDQKCRGVIDVDDEWVFGEVFESLEIASQDCDIGRDASANDDSDGHAGFSFVKINTKGQSLDANAESWMCVLDNVSGLMWEVKQKGEGLHSSADQFSWYSTLSTNNGGKVGSWGRGRDTCYGYDKNNPETFCNTQSFATRVNNHNLCSYSDWRVPSYTELANLINYGVTEPTIDTTYFPETQRSHYWSATPVASDNENARLIGFKFGLGLVAYRTDSHYVRLVRTAHQ